MIFTPIYTSNPLAHGRHMLAGAVKVNGVPAKKQVSVLERNTLAYVASTISNPDTGGWKISHINEYPLRSLLVIAFDHTGEFNAEVYDHVSQVAPTT